MRWSWLSQSFQGLRGAVGQVWARLTLSHSHTHLFFSTATCTLTKSPPNTQIYSYHHTSILFYFNLLLSFLSVCKINTHMPHTLHSFRACSLFPSSPSSVGWPDDLLQPVVMPGAESEFTTTKKNLFFSSSPVLLCGFLFFSLCWAQKLHDDQKILPRVHCWIWLEEGRKRTRLVFLQFFYFFSP